MSTNEHDRRSFPLDLELRTYDGKPSRLSGLAIPYNSPSEVIFERGRHFIESVRPGAFAETLADGATDVQVDVEHDRWGSHSQAAPPLARRRNKSLVLTDTQKGVWADIELPRTSKGADVAEMVRSKLLDGMSASFFTIKDTWQHVAGQLHRTIVKAKLIAVAVTADAAYPATVGQVTLRSLAQFEGSDPHAAKLAAMDRAVKLAEMDTRIHSR